MSNNEDMLAELFGLKNQEVTVGDPLLQKFIDLGKKGLKKKPAKEPVKKEPARLSEFGDVGDWMLTMIMVALMHVNPDKSPEDVIVEGREWARKLWQPNMKHAWSIQAARIKRHGVRAEASKIRRELYKLL